jgi:DNA polymerase-3 subunit beta
MNLTIDRDELQRGLSHIQAIVERRGTLPILSNTLITAGSEGVTLAATDLEVGVIAALNADVSTPGQITLGAKKLFEIVRELEESEVRLSTAGDARVHVESGASQFTLLAISPEEYPRIPDGEGVAFLEIPGGLLGGMIDRTLYATSSDETRYNLNGVYMELVEKDQLRFVATNGHRMAKVDKAAGAPVAFLEKGIIVPRKGVAEIRKLCEETDGRVEMGMNEDGFLIVRRPDLLLSCRLIDGEFPNYRQVIPEEHRIRLVIERDKLLHAVRRIALLAHERSRGFRLAISPGELEISVSNPDLGEAREVLPVDYKGSEFATGFNARYMQDALSAAEAKEIALELIDELSPAVIRPADDLDQIAVIMPMRQ